MCCWLVPWRYRMFQMLWLDYNHNRGVIGTRVVWRWQGSNPNNPSTHHVRFHFLQGNWKCQMPVRTEEFDRVTAEVFGTFDGVEEIWEGIVNNYLKKDILAVLPTGCGKSLLFQLTYLAYAMSKKGISRQHETFTSCQNAACSNEFFSPAGRLWLSKYSLILPFVLYWEVMTRLLIFCGLFLVGTILDCSQSSIFP